MYRTRMIVIISLFTADLSLCVGGVDIQRWPSKPLYRRPRRQRQLDGVRQLRSALGRAEPGGDPDRRPDLLRRLPRPAARRRVTRLVRHGELRQVHGHSGRTEGRRGRLDGSGRQRARQPADQDRSRRRLWEYVPGAFRFSAPSVWNSLSQTVLSCDSLSVLNPDLKHFVQSGFYWTLADSTCRQRLWSYTTQCFFQTYSRGGIPPPPKILNSLPEIFVGVNFWTSFRYFLPMQLFLGRLLKTVTTRCDFRAKNTPKCVCGPH